MFLEKRGKAPVVHNIKLSVFDTFGPTACVRRKIELNYSEAKLLCSVFSRIHSKCEMKSRIQYCEKLDSRKKQKRVRLGRVCCVECHRHNKNAVEAQFSILDMGNIREKSTQHTHCCVLKQNKEFFVFQCKGIKELFMLCYTDYIEYIMN